MQFRHHHIINLLNAYDPDKVPLDQYVSQYFRSHKAIGSKDRRFISETIYGMVRWRGLLDYLSPKPPSWEHRLSCFEKGKFLAPSNVPSHIRVSFPKFLYELLENAYGEEKAEALCLACNTQAPLMLRANLLKTSRDTLLKKWEATYAVSPSRFSPWGIEVKQKIQLSLLPEFREGLFEVQDEGSQLVAQHVAAKPGDHVLDYCAGGGGKALAFAPSLQGKGLIHIHDIRRHALEEAKKRFRRAGVQNAQILSPKTPRHCMDWVLVDAPCTGTGTLRRNPDMKWRFSPDFLEHYIVQQREIFAEALSYVRPGGHIVFATCSILPQENEEQIAYFLKTHSLTLVSPPFQSLPEVGGMDGFFAATFKTSK